ncbi:MAG TPA: M23 family metallopeptidase [Paenibacillus sp.]|uniref:M23 family metallopeptidase n=1 Tax=Paenibacillus sp. TaxID=58172 RepID=UPI0028D531D9|nr:M23 family metallopeptidase [Paenibacillus sp.]HUC92270.1 M23 family metallopeptidase [Paenibacillus sp.]
MSRKRSNRWSLMVIRGADKHVKQFQVSKRSLVAAPAAALLAVSGCFAGLQLRSAYRIAALEQRLAEQSAVLHSTVQSKDGEIQSLEEEVARLSGQSEAMKAKLRDLNALEAKLKRFIDTYGGPEGEGSAEPTQRAEPENVSLRRSSGPDMPPPPASATAGAMLRLIDRGQPDFRELSAMLDAMEQSMAYSLRQARLRKAEADAVPSRWPTKSRKLTSGFGYRTDPFTGRSAFHAGIDIAGLSGDPVFAAADGFVEEAGYARDKGNYVVLSHRNGLKTMYMHLKQAEAVKGDRVVRGEKIGLVGSTGRSTGPHLHFEILQQDEPVNPYRYLRLVKED